MFKPFRYTLLLCLSGLIFNPSQATPPAIAYSFKHLPSDLPHMPEYVSPLGIKGNLHPAVPLGTTFHGKYELRCTSDGFVKDLDNKNIRLRMQFHVEAFDPSGVVVPDEITVECNQPFDAPISVMEEGIFKVIGRIYGFKEDGTPQNIDLGGGIFDIEDAQTPTYHKSMSGIEYEFFAIDDVIYRGDTTYYVDKKTIEHFYHIQINDDWSLAQPFTIKKGDFLENNPYLAEEGIENADGSRSWDILTKTLITELVLSSGQLYNEQPELFRPSYVPLGLGRSMSIFSDPLNIELYKEDYQRAKDKGKLRNNEPFTVPKHLENILKFLGEEDSF